MGEGEIFQSFAKEVWNYWLYNEISKNNDHKRFDILSFFLKTKDIKILQFICSTQHCYSNIRSWFTLSF